jgi:hypothetical protein
MRRLVFVGDELAGRDGGTNVNMEADEIRRKS